MTCVSARQASSKAARSTKRASDDERAAYLNFRDQGVAKTDAARRVGRSVAWAHTLEKQLVENPDEAHRLRKLIGSQVEIGPPKHEAELDDLARRCLDDFELFRVVHFGRKSPPWGTEAAHRIAELFDTDDREYVVINIAPGAGKTTMFTMDIPAWLTARSRSIRGILGHATTNKAVQYTGRLRRELERTSPLRATAQAAEKRGQLDATRCLAHSYGRFKPVNPEIWRREAFTVEQLDALESGEKESTWNSASLEAEFIGDRVDFVCFDDAVTPRRARSTDMREADREMWDKVAEARVEPGGLVLLVGQRIHQLDLYRYNLDKVYELEVDGDDEPEVVKQYHHIIYPAHDPQQCKGLHDVDSPALGAGGCLLDPRAIPWRGRRGLDALRKINSHEFQLVYQQDDSSHSNSLVQKLWIDGGRDPDTGQMYEGCWDPERGLEQIPSTEGRVISYATVDPSASNYWCIMWTLYEVNTGRRFLIDMHRARMAAPDLLDRQGNTGNYVGIMEEWQRRSELLGHRITDWILERNSQQKWLTQYGFMREWFQRNQVRQFAHDTNAKTRADAERGIEQTIRMVFEHGLIRLPGTLHAKTKLNPLITEATSWPYHTTSDCLMAMWFGEYNLPTLLTRVTEKEPQYEWRPTWMGGQPGFTPAEAALMRLAGAR